MTMVIAYLSLLMFCVLAGTLAGLITEAILRKMAAKRAAA